MGVFCIVSNGVMLKPHFDISVQRSWLQYVRHLFWHQPFTPPLTNPNRHFCYRCETILVRSVFGSEIHAAVSSHFRRRFYFWRCSQFHDPNFFVRIITGQWSRT